MDPLKDFLFIATDYLRTINELESHWKNSPHGITKRQTDVLAIMENFYEANLAIAQRSSMEMHKLKLESINEHIKAVVLQEELKSCYNEVFKRNQKLALELIQKSAIPTKAQLNQEVIVK